ncbi:MAG: ROK family transcriptional regulator [Clostridia bacterium]|nr:ROK family transcriptional regulator [Clostridia bacterium]
MKPIALSTIRQQNLEKTLGLLESAPSMTRQELAEHSGLSLMTVTNLVDLLKEQEVLTLTPIQREESAKRISGRKADAISLRGDRKAWLVINISSNRFRMTLMGFDLKTMLRLQDEQPGDYLPRLEAFLCESRPKIEEALGDHTLLGVAVVTPGPYEIASDTVFNQRIPELNGVHIKEMFQRCLGNYEFYVDEDVKFAVRAFPDLIKSENCEMLYYLYIGEGVGGSGVHRGNMLRGLNSAAGDPGHMLDNCGNTFESKLSVPAFAKLMNIDTCVTADELIEKFRELSENDHEEYYAVLQKMADYAAEMLNGVLWMLDPTHIIIDCVYAQPNAADFAQMVDANLKARYADGSRRLPIVTAPQRNMRSVVLGAVHALQREWLERILA